MIAHESGKQKAYNSKNCPLDKIMGASISCYERFRCKANGAQKLLSIRSTKQLNFVEYIEVS
ncbi:MAG: hypothetical protein C1941_01115 [Prosthecochloris sp.]|nr:hypothetical protein [Prosthecochloris sp.]